ncbi:DUF397 domain-containing protein [Streptomyces sp. NPDC005438]|uniref:DUF397 domain-containing protein n=1 Tax=Streptomyces sp. NPDC005438 TaxID=3156880 RepID=UPI0033B32371
MKVNSIPDASALTMWRKSSYSGSENQDCVEVSDSLPGSVPVRDSKNPHGPALVFPATSWTSFTTTLQDGNTPA